MTTYTDEFHFDCLVCPPRANGDDVRHYISPNTYKHREMTLVMRQNGLHDHWGFLTYGERRAILKRLDAVAGGSGWLRDWYEEDRKEYGNYVLRPALPRRGPTIW